MIDAAAQLQYGCIRIHLVTNLRQFFPQIHLLHQKRHILGRLFLHIQFDAVQVEQISRPGNWVLEGFKGLVDERSALHGETPFLLRGFGIAVRVDDTLQLAITFS